jgi:predicted DNA-binding transcriptional regulator AlpA
MNGDTAVITHGDTPILLDAASAARVLSVSRSQFWRLHSAGKIPLPVRLSARCPRWSHTELERFVAAGCPTRDEWERMKATEREA